MGALILPSRFAQQPQVAAPIDRNNLLANGLVHCWGLNVIGARQLLDSAGTANGVFGTGDPGTSGNRWQGGKDGYFLNFSDGGTGSYNSVALAVGDANGSGSPGAPKFSFLTRFFLPTLVNEPGTGSALAIYASGPSGNTGGIEIRVDGSTGRVQLLRQSVEFIAESNISLPVGVDADVGVSYDGSTVRFYINGVSAGATAAAGKTFIWARQHYLGFAGLVTTERLPNNSRIYRADVWNRALSAAEFALWSSNPWQVFKAPPRRIWAVAANAAQSYSYTASGGIQFSGQATAARTSRKAASGGLVLLGAATKVRRAARAGASGIAFGGQAAVTTGNSSQKRVVTASGGMLLSGTAPARRGRSRIGSGGLALAGQAIVTQTDRTAPVRLNLYTIMRDSPINVTVALAAPVNLVAPLGTSQLHLYTIMRADPINLTAPLGGAINLTGNLI